MRLLHLEDDAADRLLVARELQASGDPWSIVDAHDRATFVDALSTQRLDAIVADFHVPGLPGLEALALARQLAPDTPFVFLSGGIGEDQAVATLRAGADDYVLKDRMKRLPAALTHLVEEYRSRELRRQAEAELRATQARYARLVDEAQDAIFSLSAQGEFTSLNPAFERMTGWPRTHWLGRHFLELVAAPDRAFALQRFHEVTSSHRPGTFELHIVCAREAPLVVELNVTYAGGEGQPTEVLGIARDITARQHAEALIREQAEIIDHAPAAIVIIGLDHRVRYWNRGAATLYGWSRAEAVGRTAEELFEPATLKTFLTGREATFRTGAWRTEAHLVVKDGRRVEADISMSLIRDAHGRPTGRLSVALDVTERKQLEEQFRRAQRMENLGLLAAGISHDLNNIFSPILMVSQLLRETPQTPAHARLLDTLDQSAQRGVGLVKQILALARGGREGTQPINLKHLARDICAMVTQTFPKNIEFEQQVPGDLWMIRANTTHLHQILLNLCVNARDAMTGGGQLRLELANHTLDEASAQSIPGARPGHFVVVSVSDTGSGIPPEILPHIWEPFFTTKRPGEGTGLGLSTVRGIVRGLNGFTTVESSPGKGARFVLYLPAELSAADTTPEAAPAELPARGSGELVLVVDDEPDVRELIATFLTSHGYKVCTAPDGMAALLKVRHQEIPPPAVVVTDVAMPRLSGEALMPLIRAEVPSARIVLMSGLSDGQVPADTAKLADAFLLKPFKADALFGAVQRALGGQPASRVRHGRDPSNR